MKKDYKKLLEKAPDHNSTLFIDYLRDNNKVVFENPQWIVIENVKYHTKDKPWYTAFHKHAGGEWYCDIDILYYYKDWGNWEWRKKRYKSQTVKRFHIHLIK